jgi:hypothetical protein
LQQSSLNTKYSKEMIPFNEHESTEAILPLSLSRMVRETETDGRKRHFHCVPCVSDFFWGGEQTA